MNPRALKTGEIVQINLEGGGGVGWFGGCLMVVSKPLSWGAQGYVKNAGSGGCAYYRVKWEDMEPTGGFVVWGDKPDD